MADSSGAASLYMQLQPDWDSPGEEDSCWLDVYERSVTWTPRASPAIHSSASTQFRLPLSPSPAAMASTNSTDHQRHLVQVTRREKQWIEVEVSLSSSSGSSQLRTVFQAPTEVFDLAHSVAHPLNTDAPVQHRNSLQLFAIDVASDERRVVVGGSDGTCLLWDAQQRGQMLPLVGHAADVTVARFFPSAQVVLTGSLDWTLRVWSVAGRCAATLRGHTGGIEDAAIVGRGRNVLSCGSDGLVQLWSVATQEPVARWANDAGSAVHCLSVLQDNDHVLVDDEVEAPISELEAETDGKVLFAGLDNGEVLGVDIRAREAVLNLEGAGSIASCATTASMLFTGTDDGLLTAWDLRQTGAPLHVVSRSSASIHTIVANTRGVWTAHGDGVCSHWLGLSEGGRPRVVTELTGPQFEPVRGLALAPQTGRIFTASRDGEFREYVPHLGE